MSHKWRITDVFWLFVAFVIAGAMAIGFLVLRYLRP